MAAQPIYRYFSERRYAEAFIAGQLRFCSLAQYRAMENDAARGDRLEGQRLHKPSSGLVLNMAYGRSIETPWTFSSTANTSHIFILCTSLKLAPEIFDLFQATCVVVIRSPGQLKSRINDALGQRYRSEPWELMSGAVSYYSLEDSPGIDWVGSAPRGVLQAQQWLRRPSRDALRLRAGRSVSAGQGEGRTAWRRRLGGACS